MWVIGFNNIRGSFYELMFRKGWYILEKSDVNKIDSKYQMLLQEYQDLNS